MSEDRITPGGFSPTENQTASSTETRPSFAATPSLSEQKEKPYLAMAIICILVTGAALLILLPGTGKRELAVDLAVLEDSSSTEASINAASTNQENPMPDSATPEADIGTQAEIGAEIATNSEESQSDNQASTGQQAGQVNQETPWAQSQTLNARRESQEILSNLFSTQQELEKLRANEWAQTSLEEIQSLAAQGDQAYQQRSYDEAIALYNSALSSAEQLAASAPEKASVFLQTGSELLENNQIEAAIYELELAALLDPALTGAKQQYQRALAREAVLELDNSAQKHIEGNLLEQGRDTLLEIKKLDSEYPDIKERIAGVEAQILERDYRQAMSEGFANLSSANLPAAEQAFQKANALKPNSDAVEQALQQVEASRINGHRQTKLDNAVSYEATERWSEALEIYVDLLNEDSTITSAQLGKIRSEARSKLHNAIQNVLDEPLKLQSEQAWQQANKILVDARNVVDRGSLLSEQIQQLDSAVKIARTKITVALFSDSQTNVEIYRMGELGQFREHAVALYPGRYVLVGTRSGYRDVREELVLDGSQPRIELNILCTETI